MQAEANWVISSEEAGAGCCYAYRATSVASQHANGMLAHVLTSGGKPAAAASLVGADAVERGLSSVSCRQHAAWSFKPPHCIGHPIHKH